MKVGFFKYVKRSVNKTEEGRSMSIKRSIAVSLSGLAASTFLAACMLSPGFSEYTVGGGGYTLFKQRCSMCHGMKGEGTGPGAPQLRNSTFIKEASLEDIKNVIRNGRRLETKEYAEYLAKGERYHYKNMPAHGKWLYPEQLDILAKWLKSGMPLR